jgi:two-component system NarL family sensor kinase
MSEGPTAGPTPLQARVLALIRAVALPVFFSAERIVEHPAPRSDPFGAILALAALYALLTVWLSFSPAWRRIPGWAYAALDFAFICALVYTSGGPFSQLRFAFFLLPIGAALLLRPLSTAAASLASILAYVAIALLYPEATKPNVLGFEATHAIFLAWMGVAATLLSLLLARRTAEVEALAASRGRLVAQALDAEDRERKRLAEALHDEAVQNLLAARHELAAAKGKQRNDLSLVEVGLDRTIEQLREAVFDLHPYILDRGELGAAIEAKANEEARRGGFRPHVYVAEDATGINDRLLFSLARELLTNVARHAHAENVTVRVRRERDRVALEVADDGRGLEAERLRDAVLKGHIGLASCAERVEALGGSLKVNGRPSGGTVVLATIPAGARASEARA